MNKKVTVFGQHDENTIAQINNCAKPDEVVKAVLMPDGHLGYGVPIGGVIAYDGHISPTGVGFDIACGNKVVKTDAKMNDIGYTGISYIMDDIWQSIAFGIGKNNDNENAPRDHEIFDSELWHQYPHLKSVKAKARNQLGTVGSGNHYVDLLVDDEGYIYIGVHFGSRGLGHSIAKHFLDLCGAKDGMMVDPLVIDANSNIGTDYIVNMRFAGWYAYAGRDWVCDEVLRIIGAKAIDEVHNNHNFAWCEYIDGRKHWVVRKGATPLFKGQRGFVGGSMGDISTILRGKGSDETLNSAVHGSGRILSRSKARGKINWKTGEIKKEGIVNNEKMQDAVYGFNPALELRGGGLDEAPQCYRKLNDVLQHIEHTLHITTKLTPVGVAMAEFEPYSKR